MEKLIISEDLDLWEAWVDLQGTESGKAVLYVIGDVFVGKSITNPVLVKKQVQGAAPGHLYLEIMPSIVTEYGRLTELCYAECLENVRQYSKVHICVGEEVVSEIGEIEAVY